MIEKQDIHTFLASLANKDVGNLGDDDSLLASKLLDSLNIAELIVFLEDRYHVDFDPDELLPENLDTVNAIVAFLGQKGVK